MESDFVDLLNREMYELALENYKNVKQENQALKDRWQKLKEWVDYCCIEYKEMLQRMEELEKE